MADDEFTMTHRLCDDDGMVAGPYLEEHNRLRALSGPERRPYTGPPFRCTGSAHLAGEHMECTSPAHLAAVATAGATGIAGATRITSSNLHLVGYLYRCTSCGAEVRQSVGVVTIHICSPGLAFGTTLTDNSGTGHGAG